MGKKYLTIIFCVISLVITLLSNSLVNVYDGYKLMNPFANKNSKTIKVVSLKNEEDIFSILKKYDNTAAYVDQINIDVCYGQAIYYSNFDFRIPMLEGRFLSKEDFYTNDLNTIVIGKDLKKYIKEINGKKIIKLNDINYEVIGVMGYKNKVSILDSRFFVNLNSYLKNNPLNEKTALNLTVRENVYDKLLDDIRKNYNILSIEENNSNVNSINLVATNSRSLIILASIMVILFLLNIINITSYYVKDKLKEIGIRKSYGARGINIFKNILKDYLFTVTVASIASLILYIIIIKSNLSIQIFGSDLYIRSIFFSYMITLFIGSFVSLIALIKINKHSINLLIKGV